MRKETVEEHRANTNDCINLYKVSDDPWDNKSTGLYKRILIPYVKFLEDRFPETMRIFDIGCGGGNILDAFYDISEEPLKFSGCDCSEEAIESISKNYKDSRFFVTDIETHFSDKDTNEEWVKSMREADVVTFIDVVYYLGAKRWYRRTLEEIWDSLKPGQIFFYGDNLKRHNYRAFTKSLPGAKVLYEYTNYDEIVSSFTDSNGRTFNRYFKGLILEKQ